MAKRKRKTSKAAAKTAPPPFTAEQIRQATHPGRTYIYEVTTPGQPVRRRRMLFTKVSGSKVTVQTGLIDEAGQPIGEHEPVVSTWDDLVAHATYPAEKTVVDDDAITTPTGSFKCQRYTVTGEAEVTRAWFARELPGAPVMLVVEVGSQRVYEMALAEHTPGVADEGAQSGSAKK